MPESTNPFLPRPERIRNNNPNYPVVYSEDVKGGPRLVADRTELYALASKVEKLEQRVTVVTVISDSDNAGELTRLRLIDINHVGDAAGWEVDSIPGVGKLTDVTYTALVALIAANRLVPGTFYRITDYQSVCEMVNVTGTLSTGPTEPLIVYADTVNKINTRAFSEAYPQDIIEYTLSNDYAVTKVKSSTKGAILSRQCTLRNIYAPWDWRNIKVRRWKYTAPAWDSTVTYTDGAVVLYSNKIYCCYTTSLNQQPDINKPVWTCLIKDASAYLSPVSTSFAIDRSTGGGVISPTITVDSASYVDTTLFSNLDTYAIYSVGNITINSTGVGSSTSQRVVNMAFFMRPPIATGVLYNCNFENYFGSLTLSYTTGLCYGIRFNNCPSINYKMVLQPITSGITSFTINNFFSSNFLFSGPSITYSTISVMASGVATYLQHVYLHRIESTILPEYVSDVRGHYLANATFRYNASLQHVSFHNWGRAQQGDVTTFTYRNTNPTSPIRNVTFVGGRYVGDHQGGDDAIIVAYTASTTGIIVLEYNPYELLPKVVNFTQGNGITVASNVVSTRNGQGITIDGTGANTLDLASTTLVSPSISVTWTLMKNDGTTPYSPSTSSSKNLVVDKGVIASLSATYQYPAAGAGQALPTAASGSFGTTLPGPGVSSAVLAESSISSNISRSVTLTKPKSGLIVVGSQVQFATGSDSTGDNMSLSFKGRGAIIYSTNSTLTAGDIEAVLNSASFQDSQVKSVSVSPPAGMYTYYVHDAAFPSVSSVIQGGTDNVTAAFAYLTPVTISNAAAFSMSVKVLKSGDTDAFLAGTNLSFS